MRLHCWLRFRRHQWVEFITTYVGAQWRCCRECGKYQEWMTYDEDD